MTDGHQDNNVYSYSCYLICYSFQQSAKMIGKHANSPHAFIKPPLKN